MSSYNSDAVLDIAKALIKKARIQNPNPQVQAMALRAAASQIEAEVIAGVQAKAMFDALNPKL